MHFEKWLSNASAKERSALTDKARISPSHLSLMKAGKRKPSPATARRISNSIREITPDRPVELHELRPDIWDAPVEQQ